jgi:hypothetical protein
MIADLQDWTGADLQHGDGSDFAFVVVDLRHADFEADETQSHGEYPFGRQLSGPEVIR